MNILLTCLVQISSTAVSPFFIEDVHELQLNSLKLISMVGNACMKSLCTTYHIFSSSETEIEHPTCLVLNADVG